eukprot:PhF_6_TR36129/c0_g1_i1/m.52449
MSLKFRTSQDREKISKTTKSNGSRANLKASKDENNEINYSKKSKEIMIQVIEATTEQKKRQLNNEVTTSIEVKDDERPIEFSLLAKHLNIDLPKINSSLKEYEEKKKKDLEDLQFLETSVRGVDVTSHQPLPSVPATHSSHYFNNQQEKSSTSWDPYGKDRYFKSHPEKRQKYKEAYSKVAKEQELQLVNTLSSKGSGPAGTIGGTSNNNNRTHEHVSETILNSSLHTTKVVFPKRTVHSSALNVKVAVTGKYDISPRGDPVAIDMEEALPPVEVFFAPLTPNSRMHKLALSISNTTATSSAIEDFSLLSNNFAGLQTIRAALDEEHPKVFVTTRVGNVSLGGNGGGGGGGDDDVEDGLNLTQESKDSAERTAKDLVKQSMRLSPFEVYACDTKVEDESDPNVDQHCTLCNWRKFGGAEKPQQWQTMLLASKLSKRISLEKCLSERQHMKEYVQSSVKYMARVVQMGVHHANMWRLARDGGRGEKGKGTIWDRTGKVMHVEQQELESCIILWQRLMAYLKQLGPNLTDEQEAAVSTFRDLLLERKCVSRQAFFDWMLRVGPKAMEARDLVKIVHFLRLEMEVTLMMLATWIRQKPQRLAGWKYTQAT